MALMMVVVLALGSVSVSVLSYYVLYGASDEIARFNVVNIDSPGAVKKLGSPTTIDDNSLPFGDVNEDDWFYLSVSWAYKSCLVSGVSETAFAPYADMTRAMLAMVLWRYAGSPINENEPHWYLLKNKHRNESPTAGDAAFIDVESDSWYNPAVAWAVSNGIIAGFSETSFRPNDTISREQMYMALYRYLDFAGFTITLEDEMPNLQLADEDKISEWELDAVRFMINAGITYDQSTFDNEVRLNQVSPRGRIADTMYSLKSYITSYLKTFDNNVRLKEASPRGEFVGVMYYFERYIASSLDTYQYKVEYIQTDRYTYKLMSQQ